MDQNRVASESLPAHEVLGGMPYRRLPTVAPAGEVGADGQTRALAAVRAIGTLTPPIYTDSGIQGGIL